jgi:aminoglycoside phosphotransferase family enzyme/predicted kinase
MKSNEPIGKVTLDVGPSIDSLERVETCFALLYRSGSEVFKIRKPVTLRLGDEPIDLSSIDRRRAACLEEERIDRRLAPGVALGVVPVTLGPDGKARFGGDGETVDWALHMRRLADAERADHRLVGGTLTDDHLRTVAQRLAAFHERARGPASEGADSLLEQLRARVQLRIEASGWPRRTPLPPEVEEIETWQLEFLEAQLERFLRRARSDVIREGHGELSLEHIFLDDTGGVRILAGLEMSPRFRHCDVAEDIALLATDLAAPHRVDLAERFVAEYAGIANDFDLYPLLDFYSSLRATLRAKLDWLCADRFGSTTKKAQVYRERARRFLALALAAPRRSLLPAAVVAMGGQVASGKSTLARHIAHRIGAPVVSSDATRDFLLGARVNDDLHEARWEESYEPDFGVRVYGEVLRRAGEVLTSGRPVVIDGCFRSREQRTQARALAQRFGRPFLFVEAQVAPEVQLERLAERALRDAVPIDVWREIADQLRAQWEPAEELASEEHLCLDTTVPLDRSADSIEAMLPTWPPELRG